LAEPVATWAKEESVKVLVVHNRYRSAQPSGENTVVDEETELLREHGCEVDVLQNGERDRALSPGRRSLPQHLSAAEPLGPVGRPALGRDGRANPAQLPPTLSRRHLLP
jgi:hypothetical protein